jgi:transposase
MVRDEDAPRGGYSSWSYREALEEGLIPYYEGGRLFQQDGARIHTAQATKDWLESYGVWTIEWPAYSPDLNPIEHAWKALKAGLYNSFPDTVEIPGNAAGVEEVKRRLKIVWEGLDQGLFRRLVVTLPRRLRAVRRARGWYTKY